MIWHYFGLSGNDEKRLDLLFVPYLTLDWNFLIDSVFGLLYLYRSELRGLR